MNGLNNDQMAGAAGGISGFADAFLSSMKQQREQASAQAAAELQRELAGNKGVVTGQELFDYGVTMGIPAAQLAPLDLEKKYNISLGKAWVDNLNAQKVTTEKEKGLNLRKDKDVAAKKALDTKGPNLAFKPEVASAKALNDALVTAGYPIGTKLSAIKDKNKLAAINTAYMDNMGGSIQAAGQQDFLEATSPFGVEESPTWWGGSKSGVTSQAGYRAKAPKVAPVVAPLTAPALPPEAVGVDREAQKKSFRRK